MGLLEEGREGVSRRGSMETRIGGRCGVVLCVQKQCTYGRMTGALGEETAASCLDIFDAGFAVVVRTLSIVQDVECTVGRVLL